MIDLTEKQYNVLLMIKQYIALHGEPPTVREICKHFRWESPSTAWAHIKALRKRGLLKNSGRRRKHRGIKLDDKDKTLRVERRQVHEKPRKNKKAKPKNCQA